MHFLGQGSGFASAQRQEREEGGRNTRSDGKTGASVSESVFSNPPWREWGFEMPPASHVPGGNAAVSRWVAQSATTGEEKNGFTLEAVTAAATIRERIQEEKRLPGARSGKRARRPTNDVDAFRGESCGDF